MPGTLHGGGHDLRTPARAALPLIAALGGMLAPAGVYLLVSGGGATARGWGIPMATDIAFSLGVIGFVKRRVPPSLLVFLTALAIFDDLGAIVVIALFYSGGVKPGGIALAAAGVLGILAQQSLGVRSRAAYVPAAAVVWAGLYGAGVHPTLAGVIVGFITPVRAWLGPEGFLRGVGAEVERLSDDAARPKDAHALAAALRRVDQARREALSPAEGLIEALHPWVAYGIMPLFALANAGVSLDGASAAGAAPRAAFAVALGLLLGKPLGVCLACFVALRLRVAALPLGLGARHVLLLGVVAGIGFTMSLFIAQLAFVEPAMLATVKLGVLGGSTLAAALGLALGRWLLPDAAVAGSAATADEAEDSTEL
jgi:NhaA family Na+:H+ antiporter